MKLPISFNNRLRLLLNLSLPKTMQVAEGIDSDRTVLAGAEECLRLVGKMYKLAASLCFHIDERDVMLGSHGVRCAAHLYLQSAVIHLGHYRQMLFIAGIHSVGDEFRHRFATANHLDTGVHILLNNITTMFAEKEFCFHNRFDLGYK
jgi:hypothetical protein